MRLEIARRTDLALRAIRVLATRDRQVGRADLAEATGTTPHFLARVMAPVVRRGWVESSRGRSGGYRLSPSGRRISVLELIQTTEGIPDESRCVLRPEPCDPLAKCALHDAWIDARSALLVRLADTRVVRTGKR